MSKLPITHDLKGDVITPQNLPPKGAQRWTANKKAILVRAVEHGLVSLKQVLEDYQMTEQEFLLWKKGLPEGKSGLQLTHFQKKRVS